MDFTDTHTHLYDKQFDADRTYMVQRAVNKGITRMLLPNVDLETIDDMLAICAEFPQNVFPMMGLHPCNIGTDWQNSMLTIEQHLRSNQYIAVGEIGIDLHWDKTNFNEQRAAFTYQMTLAKELNLPVSIHSRSSTLECIHVIEKNKLNTGGVFHCWGGTLEQAKQVVDMGFALGIGGVVTFKNSGLPDIVKAIDIQHLVLETDAPYLAPVPYRGKRNESAYIFEIVQKLAEIKMIPLKEVSNITTANAERIFRINAFARKQKTTLQ
jgi:TatD DNase family protein